MRFARLPPVCITIWLALGLPAIAAECPPPVSETVTGAAFAEGGLRLSDGRSIRFAGMEPDAAAESRLPALVAGQSLALRPAGRPDRWGRVLAHVEIAGASVEEQLLVEGLGHVAALGREACLAPLFAAEAKARAARLGVWRRPGYVIAAANGAALTARLGEHVVAEGKVISARASRGRVYVNFARYWRRGLSLIVAEKDWAAVSKTASPEAIVGRGIRLRGHLEWRGGPVILADAREPIEILDGPSGP